MFLTQIDALYVALPRVIEAMESSRKGALERLDQFVKAEGERVEGKERQIYRFHMSKVREFNERFQDVRHAELGYATLRRGFIISLVSQYDFFLGRLVRCLLLMKPETMNACDRSLSFAQLVELGSVDRAKDHLLEKEVETLLRKSHSDQFDWLQNKFDIKLKEGVDIWPTFVEVTERRNLFAHCNGRVSSLYLAVCRDHGYEHEKTPNLGDALDVTMPYFERAYRCVLEIGVKLTHVLWRKLRPDQMEKADEALNKVSYELIMVEKYDLALRLLDFACTTLKKWSSDRARLRFVVNRASASKWQGNEEECRRMLDAEDWSACQDDFQVSVAALRDEFEPASQLMRRIGADGLVKETDYKEWPVFQKFRETELFVKTFQEVFKRPLVTEKDVDPQALTQPTVNPEPKVLAHNGNTRSSAVPPQSDSRRFRKKNKHKRRK